MLSNMIKKPVYDLTHPSETPEWKELYARLKDDMHNSSIVRQMSSKYWYTPGNIIVSGYANYPGLWLVSKDGTELLQCDEKGIMKVFDPSKDIRDLHHHYELDRSGRQVRVPTPEGWLWRDMNAGRHPALDRFNAAHREFEIFRLPRLAAYERKLHAYQLKREEWYETLTEFERECAGFDWTWQMADQAYFGKHEQCESIIDRLEKMPYKVALHIWENCCIGSRNGVGVNHPNWTKCEGFEYPDKYILQHDGRDRSLRYKTTYEYVVTGKGIVGTINVDYRYPQWDIIALWLADIPDDVGVFNGGEAWRTVGEWKAEAQKHFNHASRLEKNIMELNK